jgi:20S proteasome alpha/beta subunit
MTVIVGLLCKDGLVVASDSQESDEGNGMKRLDVVKIYDTSRFRFDDAEIVVAGTGTSAHIARAAELIEEKGFAPHFTTPRSVATIVEDAIGEMAERYGMGEDGLDLELLVGVFCKECPKTDNPPMSPIAMYSVYPPAEGENKGVAEPVKDYAAMGSGGSFARYLLNRLHDEDHPTKKLSMDAALFEAVWVIEEATKVDLYCGGPTQLYCIHNDGRLERKKPKEIQGISARLSQKDIVVKNRQRELFSSTQGRKR